MENLVKIGIIGTGVGIRTHLGGFNKVPNAQINGIVGSNEERTTFFAEKYNIPNGFSTYKALCESSEIDLVCVTTPNNNHFEEIKYALSCNKHIIAEKPLAMNMYEVESLIQLSNASEKISIIDHQLRFNPYIVKVRDILSSGIIGKLYFIKVHQQSIGFSDKKAKWNWSFDHQLGGGVRLAMATHLIDLLNFWLRKPTVYTVKGAMDVVVPERPNLNGITQKIQASSFFSAALSVQENLEVHLSATAAAFGEPRFDFSIYGSEGEIHFTLNDKLKGSFSSSRGKVDVINVDGVTQDERENRVSIFSGSFVYLANKIIASIISNDRSLISNAAFFSDAFFTQNILDAILISSCSGEVVKLNKGYVCNSTM